MKITKKRFKDLGKLFNKKLQCETIDVKRIIQLQKIASLFEYRLNLAFNDKFIPEKFIPVSFSKLIKAMPFYKDQRETRRYVIMKHKTFFCPVSERCLDMDDTFLVPHIDIISSAGLDILISKHGPDKILGSILT